MLASYVAIKFMTSRKIGCTQLISASFTVAAYPHHHLIVLTGWRMVFILNDITMHARNETCIV